MKEFARVLTKFAVLSVAGAISVSGCALPGKVTGGGWIPSSSGALGDKANFGFNAAQCVLPGPVRGHFNYHDKNAPGFQPGGVKMNGAVVDAEFCGPQGSSLVQCAVCCPGQYEVEVSYQSTNPKLPGSGSAVACAIDNGEGAAAAPDVALVLAVTGPYAGYINPPQPPLTFCLTASFAPVQGNIQGHACTCSDGLDNDGDGLVDCADPDCINPTTGACDPNTEDEG